MSSGQVLMKAQPVNRRLSIIDSFAHLDSQQSGREDAASFDKADRRSAKLDQTFSNAFNSAEMAVDNTSGLNCARSSNNSDWAPAAVMWGYSPNFNMTR